MFLSRELRIPEESYTTANLGHPVIPLGIAYQICYSGQCVVYLRNYCYAFKRDP